ncbi:efflux RND transporter periplasmic adaptor subunit [Acinetobacter sp. ANC 5380]|uniref:Efflux RND transporter periplasmic adaptor subunit n=1 Tax=Acinetobacter terrae TaxID=2731247 RepID=A0A7Y2WC59_9GAMM|nr:efflux RND transporter periplasmic adaptor subunit [Acinetobacter terrae]NNH79087.1 efflux RND transporter periplasmic adaptor subunit [Acinetobacter terrae]
MSIIKTAVVSMIIVCSVTLWGCSTDATETEHVPFVMVTQPNSTHNEQKSYAGDVQARQQTALAFRVGGQIIERYVDVGDQVKVGQVLAKLDVKDAQLQLNAANAQLESAQSAAKNAEDELKRFKQLLPMNAVSRSQYDAVENQYKAALSNLKQAQSNYDVSRNQTGYNQLVANKNGVITARNIEVGQVVATGQAAYQMAIAGDREVVIGVPEQAISEIKVGQTAWVTLWSKPEDKFAAYVREISPAADQSRTFSVKVALREGNAAIQLGQSARVFFNNTQNNVLSVPLSSVSANDQHAYVWVVKPDQTIQKVFVTLGAYGRDSVPVLSGLNANDYVVIGGVHLLREKQKIQPIDRENRAVKIQAGAPS